MSGKRLAPRQQAAENMMNSVDRPGGWREERSPDGRITMYVSPNGERLSRGEFFSQYPFGTGGGQSVAAQMMKEVASGASQAEIPNKENLNVGVILQPRGLLKDFPDRMRPSAKFFEADQALKTERIRTGLRDRVLDGRPIADEPNVNKSHLRQLASERLQAFKDYNRTEKNLPEFPERPKHEAAQFGYLDSHPAVPDVVGKSDVLRRERDLRAMYESREPIYRRVLKQGGDLFDADMAAELDAAKRQKTSWLPEDRYERKADPFGQVLQMKKK